MKITVNGTTHDINIESETPLLWVIREQLQLTGTKFGCGKGLCGACTVHLNGQPIRSCSTPIAAAAGGSVTTIEGLDPDGNHPVQKAWRQHSVPQCGYCQSGQIMSAAALVQDIKEPTDRDIDRHMSGNICRCGTYQRIRQAIKTAASNQE